MYLDFINQEESDEIGVFTSEKLKENTMIGIYTGVLSYTKSKKNSGMMYHDAEYGVGERIMKKRDDRAAKDEEDEEDGRKRNSHCMRRKLSVGEKVKAINVRACI